MIYRDDPSLPKTLGRPEWDRSERHQRAITKYVAYLREQRTHDEGEDGPKPDLSDFTEEEFFYITDQAHRQVDARFDSRKFRNAMTKTKPVVSMPKLSHGLRDLYYVLAQPEMLELFLPYWNAPAGARGPKAAHLGTKALLLKTVFLGLSAHMLQNHMSFQSNTSLQRVFVWAEGKAAEFVGHAVPVFKLSSYQSTLKHIPKLSGDAMWHLSMRISIVMVRAIHKMKGVNELRLLIDGTDIPAWCEQVGSNHERDAEARKRIPRAAARVYSSAIVNDDGELQKRWKKFWRGYYLIVLVDQATGRPLVWTLRNADWDEAKALKELLHLLFEFWPNAPVSVVVGDAAWNEGWAYKLCDEYGIDLIARRSKHSLSHGIVEINVNQSMSVAAVDRRGVAYCRRHNPNWKTKGMPADEKYTKPMRYAGIDRTSKRVRFICDHGPKPCGKVGIPMDIPNLGGSKAAKCLSWQLFTYYPTTSEGRPDLHAFRVAMLARRNQVESVFSSLKVSSKIGLSGPSRTRLADFNSVRMLASLQFLTRTAFALAAVRMSAGLFSKELPVELLDDANDLANAA